MMSPLATLLFTWAALYAYVGTYNAMLHLRRPSQREYLAFALMCFSLTVFSTGSVLLIEADDLTGRRFAVQIQYVGGFAACAYFADFGVSLTRPSLFRVRNAGYLVCGAAIVADALGWVVTERGGTFAPFASDGYPAPTLTPLGAALGAAALLFAALAVALLTRAARSQRDLRILVGAAGLAFAASLYQLTARSAGLPTYHLVEHSGLLPIGAVSLILLRRFVRTSEELGRRTEELRRSYGELRITQEELVRKEQLAAVGELSAVIAHEVRNPLAVIKNAASSLRRATLRPDDRTVLLSILDEEVDRLGRLVRDLLAYARPVEPVGRPVRLGPVIDGALSRARERHPRPNSVRVERRIEDGRPLHADPVLLSEALQNVADNAMQAMPEGGTLQVRVTPSTLDGAEAVRIEVTDDGEGMPADVLERACAPFFTTRAAGSGLGLAIVQRVVQSHRGSLELQSLPGAGTTVGITLPRQPIDPIGDPLAAAPEGAAR